MGGKTFMLMAGGTGGHIFPALAVAEALKAAGQHVIWLGSEGSMEERTDAAVYTFQTHPRSTTNYQETPGRLRHRLRRFCYFPRRCGGEIVRCAGCDS